MNQALAIYNKVDNQNFEDIESSIVVVKDYLIYWRTIFTVLIQASTLLDSLSTASMFEDRSLC